MTRTSTCARQRARTGSYTEHCRSTPGTTSSVPHPPCSPRVSNATRFVGAAFAYDRRWMQSCTTAAESTPRLLRRGGRAESNMATTVIAISTTAKTGPRSLRQHRRRPSRRPPRRGRFCLARPPRASIVRVTRHHALVNGPRADEACVQRPRRAQRSARRTSTWYPWTTSARSASAATTTRTRARARTRGAGHP